MMGSKKMIQFRYLLLLLLPFFCNSFEGLGLDGLYVYPHFWLGNIQRPVLYFTHQTKNHTLELWGADFENGAIFKELPAQFMPTQVSLLPNSRGISFLDKGRIRIKFFTKRSIMSIDIDSPIYDIFSYFWVDQNSLCVCAKQYKNYVLCHLTIAGDLETIVQDQAHHLICPQKIEESLYYIKYSKDGSSYFMKTEYPTIKKPNFDAEDSDARISEILSKKDTPREKKCEQIQLLKLENIHSPISLYMIKKDCAFIVDYGDYEKSLFNCYYLEQNCGEWELSKIFEFTIPKQFIGEDSDECLTEGLFPLLPKYMNNKIYFVDYYKERLAVFSYDIHACEIKIEFTCDKHLFSPILFGESLLCGESLF